MLTLVMVLALGQVTFIERPLPDVVIGNVTPFTGRTTTNYLHGDVDRDGDSDLILPSGLFLQEKGVYGGAPTKALPPFSQDVDADVYDGKLYYRSHDHLSVYAFEGDTWKLTLEQSLAWPGKAAVLGRSRQKNPSLRFRRFLHDLNSDRIPELVAVDYSGTHLFRLEGEHYKPAGILDLPANIAVSRSAHQSIWPREAREILFPEQQMSCRLVFEGQTFRTVSIRERRKNTTRYAIQSWMLALSDEGTYYAQKTLDDMPKPLPAHLRPCRLNGDNRMDFAGGRWLRSEASPVPTPLYELWATLDGGDTFHVRRAAAYAQFRPHCAFVDFDGDGDMDMITESTQWPRGSVREQLNRFLTESRIEHVIHIYAQDEGKFSPKPDLQHRINFELESPPAKPGVMLSRYEAGSLVSLTGDFNGDGYRDLVVRSAPEELALYLATGWQGFDTKPAWSLAIPRDVDAYVADLNDDGLSDLYLRSRTISTEGETHPGTAYYAQRGTR